MWFLRWRTDDAKLLAQLEKNYEKNTNNPQKMKGLAARLEAMQKQQQAMQQRKK
jgi:YidC/Oxa1 family membrane protein insertase